MLQNARNQETVVVSPAAKQAKEQKYADLKAYYEAELKRQGSLAPQFFVFTSILHD